MSEFEFVYGINPAFEIMKAKRRQIPMEWQEKGRLISMCESRDNQGVVVCCSPYPYVPSKEMGLAPRTLLMDNLEDPQNVGAILRSAEIFGFSEVFLPLKGTPGIYPSVVKASAGASEHLRIARDRNANQYLKLAKQLGYKIAALDGAGKVELDELTGNAPEKLMLVIGGEDKGVGQFILNEADYVVKLPQQGRVNSLNASVAAGVAMYALRHA